jgi:hypothetical protein
MALQLDQMRSRIHELTYLVGQLEADLDLIATVDTIEPVRLSSVVSMLRVAAGVLDLLLAQGLALAAAIRGSNPRTSLPL